MIKSALSYVVGLSKTEIIEVEERKYSTKDLTEIHEPTQDRLMVTSLTGLVDYIKGDIDKAKKPFLVHIEGPTKVRVCSPVFGPFRQRETYVVAIPELPEQHFGFFMDIENFIIHLQSRFVKNDESATILRIVGNIKEESVKNTGDDGVTQVVTAKTGIAKVEDIELPNPCILKPYRTFLEIDQPESAFVFRMKSGPSAALFEADGGAWKYQAIQAIKEYLESQLGQLEVQIIA